MVYYSQVAIMGDDMVNGVDEGQFTEQTAVSPDTTEAGQNGPYVRDATQDFEAGTINQPEDSSELEVLAGNEAFEMDDATTQIIVHRYDQDFLDQKVSLEKKHEIDLLLASKKRWLHMVGILTPGDNVALLDIPITAFDVEDIRELCDDIGKDPRYLHIDDRKEIDANELAEWAMPYNQFLTHRYIHLLTYYNLERHHEEQFERGPQDHTNYRVDEVPVEVPVASWKSFGIGGAVFGALTALVGVLTVEQWAPYFFVEKQKPKSAVAEVQPELSNEYGPTVLAELAELDNLYQKYRDVLPGDTVKSYKILKAQADAKDGHIQVDEKGLIIGGDLGKYFMKEIELLRKSMENNVLSATGEQATLDQKVNP